MRGPGAAVGAAGLYALWLFTLGDAHLWYDLALGPCYLGAALLAAGPAPWTTRRAVALGLLLGAAALIKQQAALPLLAGAALLPLPTVRLRGAYLAGAAALPLASLLVFAGLGALPDYLYWAGLYNLTSTYASRRRRARPGRRVAVAGPALCARGRRGPALGRAPASGPGGVHAPLRSSAPPC